MEGWFEVALNTPSICLFVLSVCVCVLQMLGRTWGRQLGVFNRLCPSIVSGVCPHPPRIVPTVASPSAPPITSKSIYGYTQVSICTDITPIAKSIEYISTAIKHSSYFIQHLLYYLY